MAVREEGVSWRADDGVGEEQMDRAMAGLLLVGVDSLASEPLRLSQHEFRCVDGAHSEPPSYGLTMQKDSTLILRPLAL